MDMPGSLRSHEQIGCQIIRSMLPRFGYSEDDIHIISQLICGKEIDAKKYPFYQKFYFLQQLVSSGINALDMDKLDYIMRDAYTV